LAERAKLIVSELVTNVVTHAHTPCTLTVRLDGECLHIEVADGGPGGVVLRRPRPDDPGGRGLVLVDAVADRWGSTSAGGHTVVWCEIAA
jgi:anti-sigma regulatory factor (Ser/Thr protein kinase)